MSTAAEPVPFPVQYVIRPQSTTVTDYRGYAGQVADEYRRNRSTGGLIVIDETTNRTVAAAMIVYLATP